MDGLSNTQSVDKLQPFKTSLLTRMIMLMIVAYIFYSISSLGLTLDRILIGFGESERLLSRMFPPDFSRTGLLLSGVAESLQIAIISSFFCLSMFFPLDIFI